MLRRHHHKQFSKHDVESMRASDEAKTEVAPYRDPICEEQKRHRSDCSCRGTARLPIEILD